MLDEHAQLDASLAEKYGDVLPDSLIRGMVDAAPGPDVAQADVAAIADAVRRAPTPAAVTGTATDVPGAARR